MLDAITRFRMLYRPDDAWRQVVSRGSSLARSLQRDPFILGGFTLAVSRRKGEIRIEK
jgi:hypothetical protein